ncbi:MAG: right-handed parallel beta-helix repeat-containing protein, partial [Gemmatirosa sp.]
MASHARVTRGVATACAALLFAAGCDVHGVSAPGTLSQLVVSPDPTSLQVNATAQFRASGTDYSGAAVAVTPVWTVVSGGGSITPSGVFTAGTMPGTYTNTVKATSGDRSATATVTVTVGPLASITLTPNPAALAVRATQQFTAVGRDASGNVVPLTPTWSVVAGGGTITGAGLFTAGTVSGTFAR